jgi:hypothetical protein
MKNSIGKPCEGKLQARFDEGGTAGSRILLIFSKIIEIIELAGSTLRGNSPYQKPIKFFLLTESVA